MSDCIKCKVPLPAAAQFCPACGKKQVQERKHRKRANGTGSICKLSGNHAKPWMARKNGVSIWNLHHPARCPESLGAAYRRYRQR